MLLFLGFEHLKSLYASNEDFGELYSACLKHPKEELVLHDGYFSGIQDYASLSAALASC